MMRVEVDDLTVVEAAALVAARRISVTELVDAVLRRVEETEPQLQAYAAVTADEARRAARCADAASVAGADLGPLHGIPMGVKDVLWTADAPTEAGSRVLAGHRPAVDATAVARLRQAGAILVGKHRTQEFALGFDVCRSVNPWNAEQWSGGSSSGSGVAVAAGSALAALGTDAGGSVRMPASLNGVVGFKPSYGRVSRHGVIPEVSSVDHVGVLARSVRDIALVLRQIAGADPADPTALDEPPTAVLPSLAPNIRGVRIGVPRRQFLVDVDDEVGAATERALDDLGRLGAVMVEVEFAVADLIASMGVLVSAGETALTHRAWLQERPDRYLPSTRQYVVAASLLPGQYLEAARRARAALCRDIRDLYARERICALVLPTIPFADIPIARVRAENGGKSPEGERISAAITRHTRIANLTGQPALTLPCGLSSVGLPLGLQLIGRPFDEDTVLRLGAAYQAVTRWHCLRPQRRSPVSGQEDQSCLS